MFENVGEVRYRIVHPTLGYFLKRGPSKRAFNYMVEDWTKDPRIAPDFSQRQLRVPMDANNNGLMALLVAGYSGLRLEEVKPIRKLKLVAWKLWMKPWRVPPPHNETILARYGATLCFVAYSRTLDRWTLIANGREELIEAAPVWLCDADYARAHEIKGAVAPAALEIPVTTTRRRRKAQLSLGLQ